MTSPMVMGVVSGVPLVKCIIVDFPGLSLMRKTLQNSRYLATIFVKPSFVLASKVTSSMNSMALTCLASGLQNTPVPSPFSCWMP